MTDEQRERMKRLSERLDKLEGRRPGEPEPDDWDIILGSLEARIAKAEEKRGTTL